MRGLCCKAAFKINAAYFRSDPATMDVRTLVVSLTGFGGALARQHRLQRSELAVQPQQNFPIFLAGLERRIRMSECCPVRYSTHPLEKRSSIMLPWKRYIPNTLRSLIALGTLSAFVALAAVKPYTIAFGQEPAPSKEQTEEPQPAPVKESDEKDPVKKSDEKVP